MTTSLLTATGLLACSSRKQQSQTQSFKIQISKGIIHKIDRRLATLYGLSNEELDFIRNYDIKFRMSDTEAEGVNYNGVHGGPCG